MSRQLKIVSIGVIALVWLFTFGVNAAAPPMQEEGQAYVIQADDWLSKLAEKYLGDARLWNLIVEATNARAAEDPSLTMIENPNLVYPGQIIVLPVGDSILLKEVEPVAAEASIAVLCADQHPAVQALCSEIPMARIHFDPHEEAEFFTCASRGGIGNIQIDPNEATLLVPNDGDLDLKGITATIKVTQGRALLVPRWPGSKFDFSPEFAEKYKLPAGEQLEISLTQAFELLKAGELVWTGEHGVSGKAGLFQIDPPLTCDPQAEFEIEIGPFKPNE